MRRSLSHVGGAARITGDPEAGALLAEAVSVPTSEEAEAFARDHVHGFHTYPARMHPITARRLVEAFSAPGDRVLDPFCGSGTVLVEARLAGREGVGVDANPLALFGRRPAALGTTPEERERLILAAREAAAFADARREAKSGPTRRYGREDVELFQPHVLLEMDGIRAGIERLADTAARADLELVFSAILTKVSRKGSDTSEHGSERRLAAGYPARLFVKKTEELTRNLAIYADELAKAPASRPLRVLEGDARRLDGVDAGSVKLVATSPPYPGNYDYLAHHAARLRWLRLPPQRFDEAEIGARRHLEPLGPNEGRFRFADELADVLRAAARVLAPGGAVVFLLADSVVAGAPVYADDLTAAVAARTGFVLHAAASQARPHFHAPTERAFARRPREEHALLLVRASPR